MKSTSISLKEGVDREERKMLEMLDALLELQLKGFVIKKKTGESAKGAGIEPRSQRLGWRGGGGHLSHRLYVKSFF